MNAQNQEEKEYALSLILAKRSKLSTLKHEDTLGEELS